MSKRNTKNKMPSLTTNSNFSKHLHHVSLMCSMLVKKSKSITMKINKITIIKILITIKAMAKMIRSIQGKCFLSILTKGLMVSTHLRTLKKWALYNPNQNRMKLSLWMGWPKRKIFCRSRRPLSVKTLWHRIYKFCSQIQMTIYQFLNEFSCNEFSNQSVIIKIRMSMPTEKNQKYIEDIRISTTIKTLETMVKIRHQQVTISGKE